MSTSHIKGNILVIGALGQIASELVQALYEKYGADRVFASDIRRPIDPLAGPFIVLDVMDRQALFYLIREHKIEVIYNLAALLSAKAEQHPEFAWNLNMTGLLNTLEAGHRTSVKHIFWPSSIAVFGPNSPRIDTPQDCVMDPNTVYGISKLAGERWCDYYSKQYAVDVRSIRYPGLIGYKGDPGGGTTDYAVEIFHHALRYGQYVSFLGEDTRLPMMYMPDAIRATLQLMDAPAESIGIRSSYNLAGISFTPAELAEEIRKHVPDFECRYEPDFRQQIADSWPASIDDSRAQKDWGWRPDYDLAAMTKDMIAHLGEEAEGSK